MLRIGFEAKEMRQRYLVYLFWICKEFVILKLPHFQITSPTVFLSALQLICQNKISITSFGIGIEAAEKQNKNLKNENKLCLKLLELTLEQPTPVLL
ncbi:MAG: hypothetical protein NTX03_12940 [Bacteroidetes bacterium]|nr:hypothetical protein [Bacteroidota bacterium]